MAAQIIPICKPIASERSTVRDEDGVVVFAMPAVEVHADPWGFSCLLWRPASTDAQRLRHCRLAVRNGMAEGFLLYGDAARVREGEMLSLRVLRLGKEYWAKWGSMARAMMPGRFASAAGACL